MRVLELLAHSAAEGAGFQLYINQFVDDFRRAAPEQRQTMIAEGPAASGRAEGLVAAVVSSLCRETGTVPPGWVAVTGSPEPYFAFPARGFALRLRLMLESPAPFRIRKVFVPRDYLERA